MTITKIVGLETAVLNLFDNMKKIFFTLIAVIVVAGSYALPSQDAWAKSDKRVETELAELKRISEAQATNLATAMNQIQQVLSEFQRVNGQVDQNQHASTQMNRFVEDSNRRIASLEEKINGLVYQLEEIKAAGLLSPGQSKNLSEFKTFSQGLSRVNAQQYKGAVQSLKQFIASNPQSRYADDAQFWVGESYFALQDYPKAIAEFQRVIKKYPKSDKVPGSLLKQGFSFFEMQAFDDAKAFLSKLVSKYPRSDSAIRAKERIQYIDDLLERRQKEALEQQTSSL